MNELRKKVFAEFKGLVQDLMNEIKTAEEQNKGIDLTGFSTDSITRIQKVDEAFLEFEERQRTTQQKKTGNSKSEGWFK